MDGSRDKIKLLGSDIIWMPIERKKKGRDDDETTDENKRDNKTAISPYR